jgi:hypothetical protein
MQIKDNTQMFRDSETAVTADADSDAVQIPGGNIHTPMYAEIYYWGAAVGSSTGTAVFNTKRCATLGGSYVEHVDGNKTTVALTTTPKSGIFYIPICHEDDFTKVGLDLTGTGATIKYIAALVSSKPGG